VSQEKEKVMRIVAKPVGVVLEKASQWAGFEVVPVLSTSDLFYVISQYP